MPGNVDDVKWWLRIKGRETPNLLTSEERRQLAEVLNGPLMQPVWVKLAERIEAMKDRAMSLELAKAEELAALQALQAETRGIIVVLETMWEMTNAEV